MTILTHTLTGLAIGKLVYTLTGGGAIVGNETTFIVLTAVASNLIDINSLWFWRKQPLFKHHINFMHWPILPVAFSIITAIVSLFIPIPAEAIALLAIWLVHLFLDLFGIRSGVHLLMPFSRKEFSILRQVKEEKVVIKNDFVHGLKSGRVIIETLVAIGSLVYLIF